MKVFIAPTCVLISFMVATSVQSQTEHTILKNKDLHVQKKALEQIDWAKRSSWNLRNELVSGKINPKIVSELKKLSGQKQGQLQPQSQSGWAPLGPTTIATAYDTNNTGSMGRINCIAFHPTNKEVFWVGSSSGGIWKTENYGKSWIPYGDDLPVMSISSIAIDPVNPETIYIATGDFDGYNGYSSLGVFKTIDDGITWTQTSLFDVTEFQYSPIRKILINPDSTNQILVVGSSGICKSIDFGVSWVFTNIPQNTDIVFSKQDPKTQYLASLKNGIRKSTDFGTSWKALYTGVPLSAVSRIALAISPTDPNYLYMLNTNASTGGFHSFYSSTNAGTSWTRIAYYKNGVNILGWLNGDSTDIYQGQSGQGHYDLALIVDPLDKNKVYTGGINLWMSNDAGKNWEIASFWSNCFGVTLHCDIHAAEFNSLDSNIYVCSDGGVYRTREIKAGSKDWMKWIDRKTYDPIPNRPNYQFPTKWENLSNGLAITEFYSVAISKDNPDYVAAGAQDNSCFYYHKDGWVNYVSNWDGMSVMIDHSDPKIIYGVWQFGGLNRSDDGGVTVIQRLADTLTDPITGLDKTAAWVTPIGMDATDSKTVYIGLRNLWRSRSRGTNWQKVLDFDSIAPTSVNMYPIDLIKNSYSDSRYIAVSKFGWAGTPPELWITKDGAQTWMSSREGLPLDSISITAIEYDKLDPEIMWVLCADLNVYKTFNGGQTWQHISKPLPEVGVTSLVHYQNSPRNTLFVGTYFGIFFTNDTMTTWLPFSENIPNCRVSALAIQEKNNKLYASTYGRGAWVTSITPDIQTHITPGQRNEFSFDVYPNPTQGGFTLDYRATDEDLNSEADITIVDVRGRYVWSDKGVFINNKLLKEFEVNLENGIYFVKVNIDGAEYVKKISVRK